MRPKQDTAEARVGRANMANNRDQILNYLNRIVERYEIGRKADASDGS